MVLEQQTIKAGGKIFFGNSVISIIQILNFMDIFFHFMYSFHIFSVLLSGLNGPY